MTDDERTETQIQSAIMKELKRFNVFAYRTNCGRVKGITFGIKGQSDILCLRDKGRTLFIEVKTETGRQSPDQKAFQDRVEALGHRYIVARSVEDVLRGLGVESGA